MKTISIDLGGTTIKMGVVADGRVVSTAKLPAHSREGLRPLLPEIERICAAWMEEHTVSAIGFAFPSLVDFDRQQVLGHNNKFADCVGFSFEQWSRERFGLPTVLDNDANAAALGEMAYGSAADTADFVLMTLGTGIGSAAVMDGRLVRGKHFQAGNLFGHVPLKVNGRKCIGCPGVGCAEAQASTWALEPMVREASLDSPLKAEPVLNFQVLKRHMEAGDPLAASIFEECCEYWANCLITLIYAYDPEVVVLSGGVLNWGPELSERLIALATRRVWTPWGKLRFRLAKEPEHSVLLGLHSLNEVRLG